MTQAIEREVADQVEWRRPALDTIPPEVQRLYDDGVARRTPLLTVEARPFAQTRNHLHLKAEYLQDIGSFKVGCYVDMVGITESNPDMDQYHFVAASAGNHAQGVALAAQKLREQGKHVTATVYMPEDAPDIKVAAVQALGAEVVLVPGTVKEALEVAERQPGFFVHPFDSEGVITGNSRVGYEIMDQLPSADIVFVPTGGGGLLAGVARAIKASRPDITVIGVQLENADAVAQSYYQQQLITLDSVNTLSDGTAVRQPGELAMHYIRHSVDAVLTVSEAELGTALLYCEGLYPDDQQQAVRIEPAGALGIAACLKLERDVPQIRGQQLVAVVTGQHADEARVEQLKQVARAQQQASSHLAQTALGQLHVASGYQFAL